VTGDAGGGFEAMTAPPPSNECPGAVWLGGDAWKVSVWAPKRRQVELVLLEPERVTVPMRRGGDGVHRASVRDVPAGTPYLLRLDGELERPDPASRLQPDGVHGPSRLLRPPPRTSDEEIGFRCPAFADFVLYELHVGTFTEPGTFASATSRLDGLVDLGVTAVELMPVAQFPGDRNWGYDGVYPFAVQESYGGPEGLAAFVTACHVRGLAVILDVVYNHVGPEGNYLADFAPYFSERHETPWGPAINFDGSGCDGVRWHFVQSALYFLTEFGIDGFRVDAVHAFVDTSARPFLAELTAEVEERADRLRRHVHVIAESDLNDRRVVLPEALGGLGMHAQWCDDFHHSLHVALIGERNGYYKDFSGLEDLARAWRRGYVYRGQWSEYRQRRHGNQPDGLEPVCFVVYAQTHDQVGNRARGDRLSVLVDASGQKLAACAVLLSPFVPMLFMGEEYGETAPFLYFTSHGDPGLVEAVRNGRKSEFAAFGWSPDEIPDPQDPATFEDSRLKWCDEQLHARLWKLHQRLIALRRSEPALRPDEVEVDAIAPAAPRSPGTLLVRYRRREHEAVIVLNFSEQPRTLDVALRPPSWRRVLDTEHEEWGGKGSPVAESIELEADPPALTCAARSCLVLVRDPDEDLEEASR